MTNCRAKFLNDIAGTRAESTAEPDLGPRVSRERVLRALEMAWVCGRRGLSGNELRYVLGGQKSALLKLLLQMGQAGEIVRIGGGRAGEWQLPKRAL